ncbi:MAG: acyl carrier protein [Deltaproteobacteria bacterium]|nr:acyl carrier protein [Deltaproteobacteria bacterium]
MTIDPMQPSTLDTLVGFIREVIGDDWADEVEIGLDTSFSDDLELESIEFVALAELVQTHYGAHIDFVGWLSNLELDQIIALRVGEVVEFVDRCR